MNSIKIDTIRKVKERAEKILLLLGIKSRTIVSAEEGLVKVDIESSDSALIIGYHGETLSALRHVIALTCKDLLPYGVSLKVDAGSYLKKREQTVIKITEEAIKKVKKTGEEEILPPMNSYERMLVHQKVGAENNLVSESQGRGEDRRVVIKKEDK